MPELAVPLIAIIAAFLGFSGLAGALAWFVDFSVHRVSDPFRRRKEGGITADWIRWDITAPGIDGVRAQHGFGEMPVYTKATLFIAWAIVFLVIAITLAVLGFGGVDAHAAWIFNTLIIVFLIFFAVFVLIRSRYAGR